MNRLRLILLAIAPILFVSAATAGTVVLRANDSDFALSGQLVGYDAETFTLSSDHGELTVRASHVSCQGLACPNAADLMSEFVVQGEPRLTFDLVPLLLDAMAAQSDLNAEYSIRQAMRYGVSFADMKGNPKANITLQTPRDDFPDMDTATLSLETSRLHTVKTAALGAPILPEPRGQMIAQDALVAVAAPNRAGLSISAVQFESLMAGQVLDWFELDQPAASLTTYVSSDHDTLRGYSGRAPLNGLDNTAQLRVLPDEAAVVAAVAQDPNGVGLVRYSQTKKGAAVLSLRSSCGITTNPDAVSIALGDYPFSFSYFLDQNPVSLPIAAKEFLRFVKTDTAQEIISASGFVPLAPVLVDPAHQTQRLTRAIRTAGTDVSLSDLQRFARIADTGARFTTTLRFASEGQELDAAANEMLPALARSLNDMDLDGKEVVLVGFSDASGPAKANLKVSQNRAKTARSALEVELSDAVLRRLPIKSIGMGEAAPVACNDTPDGQALNRRVEVWIRDIQDQ